MDEDSVVSVVVVGAARSRSSVALTVAGVDLLARTDDPGEVARLVAAHAPQVVVVDLGPGVGTDMITTVLDARPGTAVLAVSGGPTVQVLAAVRAGAAGYVVRPDSAAELVDAVRRTAAGEPVFSAGLADVVLEAQGGPTAVALTERESDVLRLVVEGLTARQIATRLVLSPRTVENHVQHMQGKLGLRGRAALVRYAIEHGLA